MNTAQKIILQFSIRCLCLTLVILVSWFFAYNAFAQSSPSQSGFRCTVPPDRGVGFGTTATEATQIACSSAGGSITSPGLCLANDQSFAVFVGCISAAVCLTGDGFQGADAGGFCPDPDDDDGDGNDCDAGEDPNSPDCTCDDGSNNSPDQFCPEDESDDDRDDDGIPDSEDDDDGTCDASNDGDLDCDGECDSADEDGSDDCPLEDCQADFAPNCPFETFPKSSPSETVESLLPSQCVSGTVHNILSSFAIDGSDTITARACNTCSECSGDDNNQECPEGFNASADGLSCTGDPAFCEEDNNADGVPDNESDPLCADDSEADCDPTIEICDSSSFSDFQCEQEFIPECESEDPLVCDALIFQFEINCGVQFSDVVDCQTDFVCTGNPLQCAQTRLAHENYCFTQLSPDQLINPESLDNFQQGVDDGQNYVGNGVEGSEVDLSAVSLDFDSSGFGLSRQCFDDLSVNTSLGDFDIPISVLCPIFQIIGAIVIAVGFFVASRIVAGGIT